MTKKWNLYIVTKAINFNIDFFYFSFFHHQKRNKKPSAFVCVFTNASNCNQFLIFDTHNLFVRTQTRAMLCCNTVYNLLKNCSSHFTHIFFYFFMVFVRAKAVRGQPTAMLRLKLIGKINLITINIL